MRFSRGTFVTFAAVAVLTMTGCDDPLHPCEVAQVLDDTDFLDGLWKAQQINGSLIPQAGYKAADDDFVKAATMEFRTTKVNGGCLRPDSMSGVILVRIRVVDKVGFFKDSRSYTGSFDYDVKHGEISFRVDTELGTGERFNKQPVLTVNPIIPKKWTPMTFTLTR